MGIKTTNDGTCGSGEGNSIATPSETAFDTMVKSVLAQRDLAGLLRIRQAVVPIDATHIEFAGNRYVNFASNDYLGLTHHPKIIAAVRTAAEKYGAGSGAAGLISGYTEEHAIAEREIAQWKQTQSAILIGSGYQANLAAIQTIAAISEAAGREARFLVDKLAHASLLDAVRSCGAPFRVFPHNHLEKLERLLGDAPAGQTQVVVTESIFSMDGDAADLAGLRQLKLKFDFMLLLDEAHGSGVYGAAGAGYAAEVGLRDLVDVSVITLSKAIGCAGGAVCASKSFIEAVVNFGRAWIYSTSVPATVAAAARAAIAVMRDEPARQRRLRDSAREFRQAIPALGIIDSPIIPVVMGDEQSALTASRQLKEQGFWIVAVRPPTVPRGSSRLRITLSSEHSTQDIQSLTKAINRVIQLT